MLCFDSVVNIIVCVWGGHGALCDQLRREENHFDNEWDIHRNFEYHEEYGYTFNLDLLVISP